MVIERELFGGHGSGDYGCHPPFRTSLGAGAQILRERRDAAEKLGSLGSLGS